MYQEGGFEGEHGIDVLPNPLAAVDGEGLPGGMGRMSGLLGLGISYIGEGGEGYAVCYGEYLIELRGA